MVLAGLGRAQSVRDGRFGVPAKRRLQSHRHGGRAGVLGVRGDQNAIPAQSGTAGAGLNWEEGR